MNNLNIFHIDNKIKFSLKWKLGLWLAIIGFITSFTIHFSVISLGSSNINVTLQQFPIIEWQNKKVIQPIKSMVTDSLDPEEIEKIQQYLQSLINQSPHVINEQSNIFSPLIVNSFAIVDLQSQLITQSETSPFTLGDIGAQIAISSRDDLADALLGRNNSGIEPLNNDQYLVIKSIMNDKNIIVGACLLWQSWEIKQQENLFFYLPLKQILSLSISNTLASFIWILPSTLILGWLVARIISKRFQHLYQTIESWEKGQLENRIKTSGSDEISQSFKRLNLMAKKLNLYQQEIKNLIAIEERQNLAAELHDTVKQQLFASNLQLSSAAQLLESEPVKAKTSLSNAIKQNRQAFQQVNDLIFALSPIPIGSNLKDALLKAFKDWQRNTPIRLNYNLKFDGSHQQNSLSEIQQQVIYRSIMEALQNSSKHSNATKVLVELNFSNKQIIWSIRDNGSNLAKDLIFGQGLNLMNKRISSLGGLLSIENDQGFKLIGTINYE